MSTTEGVEASLHNPSRAASPETPKPPKTPARTRTPKPASVASVSDMDESEKPKTKKDVKYDFARRPDTYDGTKAKFDKFWAQVLTYLKINKEKDLSDELKILFILSWMTSGIAERWAQNYRACYFADDDVPTDESSSESDDNSNIVADTPDIAKAPTWKEFVRALKKTFKDRSQDTKAIDQLQKLRQGTDTVEEYRIKFEMLVDTARLSRSENRAMLSNMVETALNYSLVEKVYGLQTGPPDKYDEFLDSASNFELLAQRLSERRKGCSTFKPRKEERSYTPSVPTAPRPAAPRSPYEPKGYTAKRSGTAPKSGGKEWSMSMDRARAEEKCRHCESDWTFGHDCEPKRLAKRAYEARKQEGSPGSQRRQVEMLQEQKDDTEATLASLKDQVVLLSRQIALSKENGV